MPSFYRITEPHPSVPSTNYLYSGRGGAGNLTHVNPKNITLGSTASGPASAASNLSRRYSASSYVTVGRGGAGNVHREDERAIFSFDEELERQRRMMENAAPVYMVGRGGAGNIVSSSSSGASIFSNSSSSPVAIDGADRRASFSSSDSESEHHHMSKARRSVEVAWGRVSRVFA